MLIVTDAARARLTQILDDAGTPEGFAARFRVDGDDVIVEPGQAGPNDTTYEHEGRVVLVVDAETGDAAKNLTLDVGSAGKDLRLFNTAN